MADLPPNLPEDESAEGGETSEQGFSQQEIDAALAAASAAAATPADAPSQPDSAPVGQSPESAGAGTQPGGAASTPVLKTMEMPDFGGDDGATDMKEIGLLGDVRLDVKIELGRSEMYIDDVLKLGKGSVVELDRLAGDPVDVLVNERLVARGEVIVLNDNFCVRISEILVGRDS